MYLFTKVQSPHHLIFTNRIHIIHAFFHELMTASTSLCHLCCRCRLKTLNAKTTFHCSVSFSEPRSMIRKTFAINILPTRPIIRKAGFPLLELRFCQQIFFQVVLGSVTIARSKVDTKEGIKAVVVVVIAAVLLLLLLMFCCCCWWCCCFCWWCRSVVWGGDLDLKVETKEEIKAVVIVVVAVVLLLRWRYWCCWFWCCLISISRWRRRRRSRLWWKRLFASFQGRFCLPGITAPIYPLWKVSCLFR